MDVLASSTFRREPAAVPSARAFLTKSLDALALSVDAADRLVLAVAEACNNVVIHAGGDSFGVAVALHGGCCHVSVTDQGAGFHAPAGRPVMPPADDTGHRGLALMHALVDSVDVVSTPHGTAVVLVMGLSAPATAGAPDAAAGPTGA
jgi:serine/threonine-protein kinase RsbW